MVPFGGLDATIPLLGNRAFTKWDCSGAGLIFLPVVIPTIISPVIGWLSEKHGPRWYVVFGLLFIMVPVVLLQLVTQNTTSHRVLLCALLVLIRGFVVFEFLLWVEVFVSVREITSPKKSSKAGPGQPDRTVYAQESAL